MTGRTARMAVVLSGLALAAGATAGGDLKSIGIDTGLSILGQIVQGKSITLESMLKSAFGTGVGEQAAYGQSLAQVAGAGRASKQVNITVHPNVRLEQGPSGPYACEGPEATRRCFPVTVHQKAALVLTDGHMVYSCVGGGGRIECTPLR